MTGTVLNIRGVDPTTVAIIKRMAAWKGATLAELLTLMAGEYAVKYESEIVAWARGDQ